MNKLHRLILYFSLIGFCLNLIWEYFHMPFFQFPLYIQNMNLSRISFAIFATIGDGIIILLVHFFLAKFYKKKLWEVRWNAQKEFLVIVCAVISILVCEKIALTTGLWSYTDRVAVIPILGLNVSTFLQFIAIPITTFYLSSKLLSHK
jgi:hypothetical protein